MGKLAERLADASRSGVYRVESADALEEAAAQNGFKVTRLPLSEGVPRDFPAGDGHVLLFSGLEKTPGALDALRPELEATAARRRARGERFFAVFLDPGSLLPLAPLYNWRRR